MKRLVIILAVVIIAFFVVLGFGLSRDQQDGSSKQSSWWVTATDRLFIERRPLAASDLLGNCVSDSTFRVPGGASCEVRIRSADVDVREMKLAMAVGLESRVQLRPRGDAGAPVKIPLRTQAPSTPKLQVFEDGADLTLDCLQSLPNIPCTFALASTK